jgi:hypothetical protein
MDMIVDEIYDLSKQLDTRETAYRGLKSRSP